MDGDGHGGTGGLFCRGSTLESVTLNGCLAKRYAVHDALTAGAVTADVNANVKMA
jgi:hypothetical protein